MCCFTVVFEGRCHVSYYQVSANRVIAAYVTVKFIWQKMTYAHKCMHYEASVVINRLSTLNKQ